MAIVAPERRAALPKLRPNDARILEAVLFLIEEAERQHRPATKYEIAKAIFIGDVRHLENYGRPITFDNYVAMKDGPVPSQTLRILNNECDWGVLGFESVPWTVRPAPHGGPNAVEYVRPKRSANLNKLSTSDVETLKLALKDVQAMGFKKTRDFTHRMPAYKKAWNERGNRNANDIDYRMLLPEDGDELVAELIYASEHM